MSSLIDRARPQHRPVEPGSRRRWWWFVAVLVVVFVAAAAAHIAIARVRDSDLRHDYLGAGNWPAQGEAAYSIGDTVQVGPGQSRVPIASLAKVMTTYLVLRSLPLRRDADGPLLTVTATDVRDYEQRRADDQSVVRVQAGERLTERQALSALLLPSANNVAVMLARRVAGTVPAFVARMNSAAAALGMARTRYTDPSGFATNTVSTARDQLLLARAMSRDEVFGEIVARQSVRLPVAGVVHNTDTLLGHDGFVGTKTGSDDAAGGCFMFRTYRVVHGQVREVLGVLLGQRGRHDITAGLTAARQLADRIGPAANA